MTYSRLSDPIYLTSRQYDSAERLQSRIGLHDQFSVNPYPWHRWVFDRLNLSASASVLEVGAGTGALWHRNADRVPPGWRVLISDLSRGMVESAWKRSTGRPWRPGGALLADAAAIPLRSESVDAVIANHVIYHLPDVERGIEEFLRVLRPSGSLYATTNGHRHVKEFVALASECGVDCGRVSDAGRFGLETGEKLLAARFSAVEVLRYDNHLRVTDAGSLIRFIESTADDGEMNEAAVAKMRGLVEQRILRYGSFHVTTEAGMLRARK